MYLLLGKEHMARSDHNGAIQSFERARVHMRHYEGLSFLVVSLVSFLMGVLQCIEIAHRLRQISGWKFDNLDIIIRQHLCDSLYAAGRTKDAGESLLEMVNTLDEEGYMNGPLIKWVSSEFMLDQFGCCASETSPQISLTDTSPLPKVTVMQPRTQPSTIKRRHLFQPSIRGLPHHY